MKLLTVFAFLLFPFQNEVKKIEFPSKDGIEITADVYAPHDQSAPCIILFHQAGWSRGAYLEIAPKLNARGFNCMAVDLRSGGSINGVDNETHKRAMVAGLPTKYINAYQDIEAAVAYARESLAKGKIIIWGSSYSSSLVIEYAGMHRDVDGVLSFSPGEYFTGQGKSNTFITDAAAKIHVPVFITSAKGEKQSWFEIYDAIPDVQKTYFLPETEGNHGSRALWDKFEDSEVYWNAVNSFLKENFL